MVWFRGWSFRRKIIVSIIVCLLAPSITSFFVSMYFTKDVLREQAATYAKESIEAAELYVTNLFNSMIYITNNIQFDQSLTTSLKSLGKPKVDPVVLVQEGQKVTENLDTLVLSKEQMYVSIILPNGKFFTNYSGAEYNPAEFSSYNWFSQLDKMTVYDIFWVGTHPNYIQSRKAISPHMITMARVLRNGSDDPYAYVLISIEEKAVRDFLAKYSPNQQMVLLNAEGNVMSSMDDTLLNKPYPYQDQLPAQEGVHFKKLNNQDIVMMNKNLSFSNWQLVNVVPYKTAVERIQTIRRTDDMIQLLFLGIFIIILMWLVNRFTKPIVSLARVASTVKRGALNIRANIKGDDEIARFGRVFDEMLDNTQLMIQQITEEQTRKRKAELELLQAQMNPHFLFNLLNSIRLNIRMKGDRENADLIASLSKLLRMTINRNNEFVTLQEELEIVKHYVTLVNARHHSELKFEIDAMSDTLWGEIPRFTIQPLVENAFIHGLNQKKGWIRVRATHKDDILCISIKDNGVGMNEDQLKNVMHHIHNRSSSEEKKTKVCGIGLSNINERLSIIYGPAFHMDIKSTPGEGTELILQLPYRFRKEEPYA